MLRTELKFHELDSTSDFLKNGYQDFQHFTFVRTDHQIKGRGQFDRIWQSESGKNLLFSILLKDIVIAKMDDLNSIILNSIMDTLVSFGIHPQFKAPNDLYVSGKKICGILIENLASEHMYLYVVIGIGLNINQTDFKDLNATSMSLEKNQLLDIDMVYQTLLNQFFKRYNL